MALRDRGDPLPAARGRHECCAGTGGEGCDTWPNERWGWG